MPGAFSSSALLCVFDARRHGDDWVAILGVSTDLLITGEL